MKIIGLVGGIACGKTTIANKLRDMGAAVISADPIVHQILEIPEIVDQMRIRWRGKLGWIPPVDEHPAIQRAFRRQIAEIVFNNPIELKFLEDITAPLVIKEIDRKLSIYHPDWTPMVVLDVPLLLELGMAERCDAIWFIDMPKEDRLANFLARYEARADVPKLDREALEKDFAAREARQKPETKKQYARSIISNKMGCMKETEARLEELWNQQ